jgi:predicted alpha/beta superfamily hydrolase
MKSYIPLICLLWSCSGVGMGQATSQVSIPSTQYYDIHAREVNDTFRIYVFTPPAHHPHDDLPVLYVTDGDWLFTQAINSISQLKQDYIAREPLIVAIGYGPRKNQRDRDLHPDHGAKNFLAFIQTELMPFIKTRYQTSDDNTLFGYSLGGLFATFALFQDNSPFKTILIGSPGGNAVGLIPSTAAYLKNHPVIPARFFLAAGSYELETAAYIRRFESYINSKLSEDQYQIMICADVGHGSAVSAVMQNAIRFAYCKQFTPTHVPVKQLKGLTGPYAQPGRESSIFTVFLKDNELIVQQPGLGEYPVRYPIYPVSDTSFFMKEAPDRLLIFPKNPRTPHFSVQIRDQPPIVFNKLFPQGTNRKDEK